MKPGVSPHVLARGTEAHYEDPLLYDRTYARRTDDVRFYVGIADELAPQGAVLELGAGSGRVSIALAREGLEVVAVDRMKVMRQRLAERLKRETAAVRDRVEIRPGDLKTFRYRTGSETSESTRRFPLVIAPFNVFMHLYTRRDMERALQTCREHLTPRGALVFDVLMPDLKALARDPHRPYVARPIRDPRTKERYRYEEFFAYDAGSQVEVVTAVMRSEEEDIRILPLAHRQFFPAELEALLHYNGFSIRQTWGGFDRSPLSNDCESQIIVAKKRA